MIYGYCRVSTANQNIERQIRNIKELYPSAVIIKEVFTGRTTERKEFKKLLNILKSEDIIIFDSLCRMSRDTTEGIKLYKELFNKGVELVFLKEEYLNTTNYKKGLLNDIQLKSYFDYVEREVKDLSQRTKEGLVTAKLNGKQIGGVKGVKLTTKKSIEAKRGIKKYSKAFNGSLVDKDVIKLIGISRNSYYKYKKELLEEN